MQPDNETHAADGTPPRPAATTLGELRASGHEFETVKEELRRNLLARMRAGEERFPGIVGFDQTVLPHVERALLAGHDTILLGERGQGKTRLIRTLTVLLDEWTPAVAGCEINDHPYQPVCARCQRLAAEQGDDLPVTWRHRSERYGEKLATPDTSVGDLIGDIDPVKVAEGRTLGDPETIHFGLVPRTNRGIFCLNELPDLAERIQVALLNVLEERDIGVRGYALRLPLDLILVASANPEDYTNRGRIITPLKDRFGAEIRTHYPLTLDEELALTQQEALVAWDGADPGADLPEHLVEVIARFTRLVRSSPAVDSRSGVSARFAIAAAESVAASAVRRAALTGEAQPVARICDLPPVVSSLRGKVEFEVSEEGRETEVLEHLLRRAIADTFRSRLGSADLSGLLATFEEGGSVETGDLVPAATLLNRIGEVPGLARIMDRLGMDGGESFGEAAAALEFALEGLYLMRRLSKDVIDGSAVYRHMSGGYRYGEYHDGPDPLAAPFDARGALDELGDAVLDGADPSSALRDLLRRGRERPPRPGRPAAPGPRPAARDPRPRPAGRRPGGSAGAAGHRGRPGAGRAVPRPQRRGPAARGRAGRAAVRHRAGHPQAGRLQLAQPDRPGDLRAAQGPAPQRGAGQPVPRHEGSPAAAGPRGHAAGQGHDGRPQPDAGGGRPGRAHPGGLRRLHGPLRRDVPGEPGRPRGAGGLAGPPGHRRAAAARLAHRRAA